MVNLINFDSGFKIFNYKESFDFRSALWLAYLKAHDHIPPDSEVTYPMERYQRFMDRVVQEVKTANQTHVNILQIDLKKYSTQPPDYNLKVIAQALYRYYGIELKQVDQPSHPEIMVLSWNRDNPLFNISSNQFQAFRQRKFLVDYQIKYDGQSFPVHKVILAAKSPFFQSQLEGGFKVSEEHQIPFEDVKATSVAAWLDYLYTDEINITEDTVSDFIRFAKYYGLNHLQQKCCNYLCKTVNFTNLVQFIGYGLTYELTGLEEALVASIQSDISLETLETCLTLIRDYEIKNLEAVCLAQIEKRFNINFGYLEETRELLEIADKFSCPKIKSICHKKFKQVGIHQPTLEFAMNWFALACKYELIYVGDYCIRTIPDLLQQSDDLLNEIKPLLQLADQYDLASMKETCTGLLMEKIEEDRDKVLVLANKFNLESLKQACLN